VKYALRLQVGFIIGSFVIQCLMVKFFDANKDYLSYLLPEEEKVETLLGMNVKSWGISKRFFLAVTLCPNYAHVHATSIFAGTALRHWTPELQDRFFRTWEFVPVIGHFVGTSSMPHILLFLLGYSCVMHAAAMVLCYAIIGRSDKDDRTRLTVQYADAANLLFAGAVLLQPEKRSLARMLVGVFVKGAFIWAKTACLAMEYDSFSRAQVVQATVSIMLAWYAMAPLISFGVVAFDELNKGCFCTLDKILVTVMLVVLITTVVKEGGHFLGVFLCPSHDFSLLHCGCTEVHAHARDVSFSNSTELLFA